MKSYALLGDVVVGVHKNIYILIKS